MSDERAELRERAQMRSQLYTDLLEIGWPGVMEEDAAFVADKLWEKGWRLIGGDDE